MSAGTELSPLCVLRLGVAGIFGLIARTSRFDSTQRGNRWWPEPDWPAGRRLPSTISLTFAIGLAEGRLHLTLTGSRSQVINVYRCHSVVGERILK